jgi:histidine kinase 2/3/4 (cytokinin receptor)
MGKSGLIHGGNQVNGMSCIRNSLAIRDMIYDAKQNWLKDAILQQFCTVQDKYGVNSHAPAVLEAKFLQNVIQEDISSTTQGNVSVSFYFLLYALCEWQFLQI